MPLAPAAIEILYQGEQVAASALAGLRALVAAPATGPKPGQIEAATIAAPGDMARLWTEVRALDADGRSTGLFQSAGWIEVLAEHADGTARFVAVRESGVTKLIIPLAMERRGPFRVSVWLGDPVIQYGDVLAALDVSAAHFDAALSAIRAWGDVDALILRRVRDDALAAPFLKNAALDSGPISEAPFLALDGYADLDAYRASTSSHARRRRRADRRKLAECGPVTFRVLTGNEALAAFDTAIALKRQWLSDRGLASPVVHDEAGTALLRRIVAEPEGGAVLSLLEVDGEACAIEIGFVHGRHYYAYLGATSAEHARFGPGKLQMEETIGWCIRQGLVRYDLMAPADAYKLAWTDRSVSVSDHAMALNWRGGLLLSVYHRRLRPAIKRLHERAPMPLKKLAATLIKRG